MVGQVARCAKVVSYHSTRVVDAAGDGCRWFRVLYGGRLRWMADKCGGVALAKPWTSTACCERCWLFARGVERCLANGLSTAANGRARARLAVFGARCH